MNDYDFVEYILHYDVLYESGVIFAKDAFKVCDGHPAPIAMHYDVHDLHSGGKCLGIAIIENRDDGVVAKCKFADTPYGKLLNEIFATSDDYGISVYANQIQYDKTTCPTSEKKVLSANVACVIVLPKVAVLRPIKQVGNDDR